jgi:hypothetical protein
LADAADFFFDSKPVQTRKGQAQKQTDPAIQNHKGAAESALDFFSLP